MAQQIINIGAAQDDGTGDIVRDAFDKTNDNFTELYSFTPNPASVVVECAVIDDFPAPSAGEITLADGTVYLCVASINFGGNRLIMGNNTELRGASSLPIVLTYTGSAAFITSVDNPCGVSDLTISATTPGASVVAFSTLSLNIMRFADCTIVCDRFADFSGTDFAVRMTNVSIFPFITGAITFAGTCRSFQWFSAGIVPTTGVIMDLGTCVFDSFVCNTIVYELPVGSTFISGLTGSGNISANGRGLVINCQGESLGGTHLVGVTSKDARWKFSNNTPIEDSRPDFLLALDANATVTTITTNGVYTRILGTWDITNLASQFNIDANGRATYTGVEPLTIPLDLHASLVPASGTNKEYAVKFYSSAAGAVVGPTLPVRIDSGDPKNSAAIWQLTFNTNDYVEPHIANITPGGTDTTNVLVSGAVSRGN